MSVKEMVSCDVCGGVTRADALEASESLTGKVSLDYLSERKGHPYRWGTAFEDMCHDCASAVKEVIMGRWNGEQPGAAFNKYHHAEFLSREAKVSK